MKCQYYFETVNNGEANVLKKLYFMLTILFIAIFILMLPPIAPVGETFSFLAPDWTNDYYYDLITCGVFLLWITRIMRKDRIVTQFQLKIEKVYCSLLIIGIIPVIVGYINENSHLLYAYRFFFYFVWVPAIMQLFQNQERSIRLLKIIIGINFASILFALINHFNVNGLTLSYLDMAYTITLILCIVILSTILHGNYLFRSKIITYSIFYIYALAILINHSRRIYIAILIGITLLLLQILGSKGEKHGALLKMVVVFSIILISLTYTGIYYDIAERFSTMSNVTGAESMDKSIEFRRYAMFVGIEKVMEHPYLGVGTGYDEGLTTLLMKAGTQYGYEGGSPHNFFISSMHYYGIPIMLFVLYFILKFMLIAWKYSIVKKTQKYDKVQSISIGMIIGFIANFCILFLTGYGAETTLSIWLFLGMIMGFANQINANKAV